ncbi:urate oxidase [Nocardioides sp. TRM66260-LWL]|uniref:factor-independent urate hydroxylase n=1 Tax=Nocardioides sp. TRM66260-LWL TaxID=2874478 RepID=UPI001CC3F15E|nr:urate oxidase [Nocardioides sp. TRM66260-LWL]MBZ5734656.1 urate oxidase [Nocardioides sp. TRM66260-LWL]
MADGDIVLGANQYGKAECRLVRVERDTARHAITDLTVTTQLRGDFEACHLEGDNSLVVATDTQKNTVYAFAREHGVAGVEPFLLTLADHFVETFPQVSAAEISAEQHAWERIEVDGRPHDHSFVRSGREVRTARVVREGEAVTVHAGLTDCVLLKSTGSEFHGFPRDRYTTLAETDDRILATSLTATWRYAAGAHVDADLEAAYASVRAILLATFADLHSLALQQTIHAMGRAVLEAHPEIAEISLRCPNKHHFLVDLAPFGLDNPGEVFVAADRPYGLIQATVLREGA